MLLKCKQTITKNVPTSQFAVFFRGTSQLDLFDFLTFAVQMILWCYYYLSCTHTTHPTNAPEHMDGGGSVLLYCCGKLNHFL